MDTGTKIAKCTLKDWIMATVQFSQQQHDWWQAPSSYACTRPGRTLADVHTTSLSRATCLALVAGKNW